MADTSHNSFGSQCLAPFSSVMVKPSGGVTPDPHFIGEWGNLKNSTLKEIVGSQEALQTRIAWAGRNWPEACRVCESKTKSLGHSRKKYYDEMQALYNIDVAKRDFTLRFLDISTSNLCNLACVMCSSKLSTAWIPAEKRLAAAEFNDQRPGPAHVKYRQLSEKVIHNLFADPELLRKVFYLGLRGGEPFIDPLNDEMITRMLEIVPARQLVLDVTSNGTKMSPMLLSRSERFREVKLLLSFEGLGETYSLMRGGPHFSFSQFEENVKQFAQLPHVNVYLVFLLTALNFDQLVPIWKWYKDLNLPNVRLNLKNILVNPSYLSPQVVPLEQRSPVLRELELLGWPDFQDTDKIMGLSHVYRALKSEHSLGAETQARELKTMQRFLTLYTNQ